MMLKKLPENKIKEMLRKRNLEELETLKLIENKLKKERGYVFRMPAKGAHVISHFSGGLDSTAVTAMLIEEFSLTVYPLFIDVGHVYNSHEEKAAVNLSRYFRRRYGRAFKKPNIVRASLPFAPIPVTNYKVPPAKQNYFYSLLQAIYAIQFANRLKNKKGASIRNIFISFMRDDGEHRMDQTLTAARKIMYTACLFTGDYDWQISALPIEKELGLFYDKPQFIKWGRSKSIPLERTRSSCKQDTAYHCGMCDVCTHRQQSFKKVNVEDKTKYHKIGHKRAGKLMKWVAK